jgi:hypothetical protein
LISPLSPFSLCWTLSTALLLAYTAVVTPPQISFGWLDPPCSPSPTVWRQSSFWSALVKYKCSPCHNCVVCVAAACGLLHGHILPHRHCSKLEFGRSHLWRIHPQQAKDHMDIPDRCYTAVN